MNQLGASQDQSLLTFYESIRRQVEADRRLGGRHRFVGRYAKQYAERLHEEMDRRKLRFVPIDWSWSVSGWPSWKRELALHPRYDDGEGLARLVPIGSTKLDALDFPVRIEPGLRPPLLDDHVDEVFALGVELFDSFPDCRLQISAWNQLPVVDRRLCPTHDKPPASNSSRVPKRALRLGLRPAKTSAK
jgi:hypothetical protein